MKNLAMVLKIEAVTEDGIVDIKDEADMDYAAKAINAYPQIIAALRGIVDCARARNVKIDKAAECDAIATAILRQIGEES